ncbi:hypothetical protein ACF08E_31200 [Streptomyces globisporus]|uniref:hypothetical protein n=1 Tax=Streptomyces globisporus TaxID=1908 RepID=UPI0036F5CF63
MTFTARDWPAENGVDILAEDSPSFDWEGTWSLVNDPGEAGLSFENRDTGSSGTPLRQLEVGKGEGDAKPLLFAKLGDPDVCRVYERERQRSPGRNKPRELRFGENYRLFDGTDSLKQNLDIRRIISRWSRP